MKRLLYIIIFCAAVLSACKKDDPTPIPPPNPQPFERTVIFYMMAQNSLSDYSTADIEEMVRGRNDIPENCNVFIYKDDIGLPVIYQLTRRDGLKIWKSREKDELSTDSVVMRQTLLDIVRSFPSTHYGLVLWSHGSGWIPQKRRSLGVDNNQPGSYSDRGLEMNITSLRWVLEQMPRMDYIFFDVCFMQQIEIAYELRHVTDWMVGSPAEIPGPGAFYDRIMKALCTADIQGIVNGYDQSYPCDYVNRNGTTSHYTGVLLSAIKCDELDALAAKTREYLPLYMGGEEEISTAGMQPYSTVPKLFTHCLDMNSIMYQTLNAEHYAEWFPCFDRAVPIRTFSSSRTWVAAYCYPAWIQDPLHYGGITMFLPSDEYAASYWNLDLHGMQWYQAAGWNQTKW